MTGNYGGVVSLNMLMHMEGLKSNVHVVNLIHHYTENLLYSCLLFLLL